MNTSDTNINEFLKDFLITLEQMIRKSVAEEIRSCNLIFSKETSSENEYFTAVQAASFLGRKLSTLYKDVHLGIIPFHRSGGRKLLFSKKELEEYILKNKVKSAVEIEDEVSDYIQMRSSKSQNKIK